MDFTKIKAKMSENPEVTITYFLPDEKKVGGRYESHAGVVKKMDEYKREWFLTTIRSYQCNKL